MMLQKTKTLLILLTLIPIFSWSQVSENDSLILVEIYNVTDGPNWTRQTNWLQGPVGDWDGITVANGRVSKISFTGAGLTGTIPNSIFQLDALESFSAQEGRATLQLTAANLSGWPNIEILSLIGIQINNTLDVFCGASSLIQLSVTSKNLTGSIPSCLSNLALTRFSIGVQPDLTPGPIPDFLGQMPTLQSISLSGTNRTGTIPNSICNLDKLRFLTLSNNDLTGEVPSCLNQFGVYNQLFLDGNNFTGEFPFEVIDNSMAILTLNDNNFVGDLSDLPSSNMGRLDIQNNSFTGTLDGSKFNHPAVNQILANNNKIDKVINFENLNFWGKIRRLEVQDNLLTFQDLEVINGDSITSYRYSPQSKLGTEENITLAKGSNYTLTCDAGGSETTYQWYKDNVAINGATTTTFSITDGQFVDGGIYFCEAKNIFAPDLTIESNPVTLRFGTVSTQDFKTQGWTISPNPAIQFIQIDFGQKIPQDIQQIRLVNTSGLNFPIPITSIFNGSIRFPISDISSGVYTLLIEDKNQLYAHRIVILAKP